MPSAIPTSTYRLQLTAEFGFKAAAKIVPYLKQLGISHVYASPFLKARAGSTHGYDIIDHNQLNPELGGEDGFATLTDALKKHDLGLILDFVPNHMGVHFADNEWWLSTLEWGAASPYAAAFDIDWDILPFRPRGGVLLPILGSSYGHALDNGDIALRYDADTGSFSAWYFEHRLPVAPERYGEILRTIVKHADTVDDAGGKALLDLAAKYEGLRRPTQAEAPDFKAAIKAARADELIARGLEAYRSAADRHSQRLALHHLLERQHYRLGHWRLASSDINYRRFFDVNSLAGLRVEDPTTFRNIHKLVAQLIAQGRLQGLRLDHIDGLRDPAQYAQRLRRLVREAQGDKTGPFYILIEKILGEHEELPRLAGVHGTTGYEWLNAITQVLLDGEGLASLDEAWRQVSNQSPRLEPVLREGKRRVLETLLTSEFTVLTRLLARIAAGHFSTRDFSADILREALELYVLNFPVYRTYLTGAGPTDADRALINDTIDKARAEWFAADDGVFDFIRDTLTLDLIGGDTVHHSKPRVRRFALKIQQFTGPMMAKSLEDTSFYRYHRLLALNEVGGEPAAGAMPFATFHAQMEKRARDWPHGMTATATHDTKRGEDARTRILALAELSGEWISLVARWKMLNAPLLAMEGARRMPSATFEYMLYQALVGAWPLEGPDEAFVERVQAFALKAAREGKQETSWLNPDEPYEAGMKDFIARILDPAVSAEFIASMQGFAERCALIGALNSLSQITLKAMMPGVPDFYQGTEMWDCSFVDPDNRRAVDYPSREATLAAVETPDWAALTQDWTSGRVKLAWTHELLKQRNALPDVFSDGDYVPLTVTGRDRDRVLAFARRSGRDAVIVAVAKCFAPSTQGGRTWPSPSDYEGEIVIDGLAADGATSGRLALRDIFAHLPVATIRATRAPTTSRSS